MKQTTLFDLPSEQIEEKKANNFLSIKRFPQNPNECIDNLHCVDCGWYPTHYREGAGCLKFLQMTGSNKAKTPEKYGFNRDKFYMDKEAERISNCFDTVCNSCSERNNSCIWVELFHNHKL